VSREYLAGEALTTLVYGRYTVRVCVASLLLEKNLLTIDAATRVEGTVINACIYYVIFG
jgi:hypothetical protein